jgi:hypothetical protein
MQFLPDATVLPSLNPDAADSFGNLLVKVQSVDQRHAARVARVNGIVEQHYNDRLTVYSGLSAGTMTNEARANIRDAVAAKAGKDAKDLRDAQNELNREALDADEREAVAVSQRLTVFLSAISDCPAGLISHVTLTEKDLTEKRIRYQNALQFASHSELKHRAIAAAATSDWALTAAVLAHLDRLPNEQRPVHPATLAAKVGGQLYNSIKLATDSANHALQSMVNRRREFASGRSNSLKRIESGLKKMEIDKRADALA